MEKIAAERPPEEPPELDIVKNMPKLDDLPPPPGAPDAPVAPTGNPKIGM
ncbi:hypothetical protein [Treponema sp. R6D11]